MNDKIQFRAWDEKQKYMAYQGDPDLETLQSFIHHFGDKELMQWTGFCDCNGKKIYEKMEIDNQFIVDYQNGSYILRNILNNDIIFFRDYIKQNEKLPEITREYSEI